MFQGFPMLHCGCASQQGWYSMNLPKRLLFLFLNISFISCGQIYTCGSVQNKYVLFILFREFCFTGSTCATVLLWIVGILCCCAISDSEWFIQWWHHRVHSYFYWPVNWPICPRLQQLTNQRESVWKICFMLVINQASTWKIYGKLCKNTIDFSIVSVIVDSIFSVK